MQGKSGEQAEEKLVEKSTESGIILDETGAESLLGKGDMLIKGVGSAIQRVHGYFIQTKEIEARLKGAL